ncbi:MAG: MG2 domain-containing protein, partial [Acidobacteriota bacterium]
DFLRRWDPITVFFERDVGPSRGGPAAPDLDGDLFSLYPEHPGELRWLDARTLQFRPADPWPALARFSVRAAGQRWPLVTLMAPPESTLPENRASGVLALSDLTLTYAEPLDPGALARSLSVELRPLPGASPDGARWLSSDDFAIKELERRARDEPASYVVSFPRPLPQGHRVLVHQQLSFDLGVAGRDSGRVAVLELTTAEPFRVTAFGCGSQTYPVTAGGVRYGAEQAIRCDPAAARAIVELSAAPAGGGEGGVGPVIGRNLVRLSPAVEGLEFSVSGSTLRVDGDFVPDTVYRLALAPTPLEDADGRLLEDPEESEVHLYFPSRPSYLGWTTGSGLVERYGPQALPVEGRGEDRFDLRIHAVPPTERNFWPFPEQPVSVEEWRRPPGPGEQPGPFRSDDRWQTPRELAARLHSLGSPTVSKMVDLPAAVSGGPAARFGVDLGPTLEEAFGGERAGTYLVGLRRLDGSRTRTWTRVQVTDLALTTFEEPRRVVFAVTSLRTGRPVPGATVRVEGAARGRGLTGWQELWRGTADARGLIAWDAPGAAPKRSVTVRRLVVEKGEDSLVLDPTRAPRYFRDGGFLDSGAAWLQWTQETLDWRGESPAQIAHLFSERPVYRPEEPVHLAGFLRTRSAGRLEPIEEPGFLVISGPGGREWRERLVPSASGSIYHLFDAEDAPSGVYRVSFQLEKSGLTLGGSALTFRKEAYRLPRFEVLLSGPEGGAGAAVLDRPFEVQLAATYYAGGRVARRPVRWQVTQFPYDWRPPAGREGFVFASDGRYSQTGRFESTPSRSEDA